jgi:ABC-2 type transport system permease protein
MKISLSDLRQTWIVARWEFFRFYKIKNELIGMGVMLVVGVISYFLTSSALSQPKEPPRLAVLLQHDLAWQPTGPILKQAQIVRDSAAARSQLEQGKIDGLLSVQGHSTWELLVATPTKWTTKVEEELRGLRADWVVAAAGITSETYTMITQNVKLERVYLHKKNDKIDKIMAVVFIMFILVGIFLSFAYQFTAITGEKQQRITEQIISAVKPKVWMDGKILGITLTGISSIGMYMLLSVLGYSLYLQVIGEGFLKAFTAINFPSALLFLVYALLSILMWNAFMAAISSMITDPNNSSKNGLLMLPILPAMTGFLALSDPDSGLMRFLSFFPFTSGSVIPARLVLGQVSAWEVVLSLVCLLIAIWAMRKLAGIIFHTSVLITGKEPSILEVWKWARSMD